VNNEFVTLPSSFGQQVTINQVGYNVEVQTNFGLRVLYDTFYHAEVHVPSNYQGRMCGLHGHCQQLVFSAEVKTKTERYRRGDACGLMAAAGGPFSACHGVVNPEQHVIDCVFDLCVMDGDRATLCENLQAYAIICQQAGRQIMPWRNSSFC
ncbi:hypothetical protein M9458_030823, partial [Cirrhinus mrigala]